MDKNDIQSTIDCLEDFAELDPTRQKLVIAGARLIAYRHRLYSLTALSLIAFSTSSSCTTMNHNSVALGWGIVTGILLIFVMLIYFLRKQ